MSKKTREIIILSGIVFSFGVVNYILYRLSIIKMLALSLLDRLSDESSLIVIIIFTICAAAMLFMSYYFNRKENEQNKIRYWIIVLVTLLFYAGSLISLISGRMFIMKYDLLSVIFK